jgi:hypothetical protein
MVPTRRASGHFMALRASGEPRIYKYVRISAFPALGVAEARAEALEMRAVVDRDGNPLDERDRLRSMRPSASSSSRSTCPTPSR